MTGGTKVPSFAGKGQEIFMTALSTTNTGKPVMQQSAVQIPIDHLFDIRAKETVFSLESIFINAFKGLEMVLHALIIRRVLGVALSINGCRHGYSDPISCRVPIHAYSHLGVASFLEKVISPDACDELLAWKPCEPTRLTEAFSLPNCNSAVPRLSDTSNKNASHSNPGNNSYTGPQPPSPHPPARGETRLGSTAYPTNRLTPFHHIDSHIDEMSDHISPKPEPLPPEQTDSHSTQNTPLQIASSGSPPDTPSVSSATSNGDSNKPDRLRAINRTYHVLLTPQAGSRVFSKSGLAGLALMP